MPHLVSKYPFDSLERKQSFAVFGSGFAFFGDLKQVNVSRSRMRRYTLTGPDNVFLNSPSRGVNIPFFLLDFMTKQYY